MSVTSRPSFTPAIMASRASVPGIRVTLVEPGEGEPTRDRLVVVEHERANVAEHVSPATDDVDQHRGGELQLRHERLGSGGDEPLVWLAAVAEWGIGAHRLVTLVGGWGAGTVTAQTYEYGNTFLIVAGLLNMLVVIDAFDVAMGRK